MTSSNILRSVLIEERKLDYLFNKDIKPDPHNSSRAAQNAQQLQKLGIYDDREGRSLLQKHLITVVKTNGNIIESFTNAYGKNIENRESLLAGSSGKFLKILSSWEILPNGIYRLVSCQFFGT